MKTLLLVIVCVFVFGCVSESAIEPVDTSVNAQVSTETLDDSMDEDTDNNTKEPGVNVETETEEPNTDLTAGILETVHAPSLSI